MFVQVYVAALTFAFSRCQLKSFIYLGFIQPFISNFSCIRKWMRTGSKLHDRGGRHLWLDLKRTQCLNVRLWACMTDLPIVNIFGCAIVAPSLLKSTLVLLKEIAITFHLERQSALVLSAMTAGTLKLSNPVIHVKKLLKRIGLAWTLCVRTTMVAMISTQERFVCVLCFPIISYFLAFISLLRTLASGVRPKILSRPNNLL